MPRSDTARARLGLLLVAGLGVVLLALHALHAARLSDNWWAFVFGSLVPAVPSAGLVLGAGYLWRRDLAGTHVLRIGLWVVLGAATLAAAAVLTILHEQAEGVVMTDQVAVGAWQASLGAAVGFVVGTYDVNQRRYRESADRLNRQLTILNRVLRHDVRNVANVIHGRADLLASAEADREGVEIIKRHAGRLVELGDHARTVEELAHTRGEEREAVDLVPLLEAAVERLEGTYPDVEVDVSTPESAVALAHPLVESAVANVLENAVVHNDASPPRIEVWCAHTRHPDGKAVEVRVADNGPGMPAVEVEALERGFETPLAHSSGLGLWLVNWIVRESRGEVSFEANRPRGSVVCFRFERA